MGFLAGPPKEINNNKRKTNLSKLTHHCLSKMSMGKIGKLLIGKLECTRSTVGSEVRKKTVNALKCYGSISLASQLVVPF